MVFAFNRCLKTSANTCLSICLPTGSRKHTEDDAAQTEGGGEGSDEEFP